MPGLGDLSPEGTVAVCGYDAGRMLLTWLDWYRCWTHIDIYSKFGIDIATTITYT